MAQTKEAKTKKVTKRVTKKAEEKAQVEQKPEVAQNPKVIVAEKANKLWKVYILNIVDSTKESEFFFHDPLKAMRYSFILKAKSGVNIAQEAINFLVSEHKAIKNELSNQAVAQ